MYKAEALDDFLKTFRSEKHQAILSVYIASLQAHIEACLEAQSKQDVETLTAKTHDLKSLSYQLGAQEAGDIAARIEGAGKNKESLIAFDALPDLLKCVENIVSVLSLKLQELE